MLAKEKSIEIVFGLIKKYKEMVKSGEYPNLEPIKLHIEEIMLDIMLPKIDGLTVCKRVKNSYNIPIILTLFRM